MAYFRGPQSPPRDEQYLSNPLSPPQRNPNRWSASMASTSDVRGALHRRFTTNTVPTLTPIGQQRRQGASDSFQNPTPQNRLNMTPSERAARHYENLLQAQRKIQEELEKVDAETRREVDENIRHEQSVTQLFAQSEPTTPPEYHAGFPNSFSRPSRYSITSLASPPGIFTRSNRASTHLTSPSSGFSRHHQSGNSSTLPSQSVPGSRRQSDDEDDDAFVYSFDTAGRAAANLNRNSMPIPSYDRKRNTTDLVLGPINANNFPFEGDDKLAGLATKSNQTSPPDTKTFLQVQHTADGFPKLIRRGENGDIALSAAPAALDLALSSETEARAPERTSGTRHHRVSLPPNGLSGSANIAPLNSILANANANDNRPSTSRRSMEVKFTSETKRPGLLSSPPRANGHHGSQSYSTNDLPTLKTINGEAASGVKLFSPTKQSATLADPTSPDQGMSSLSRMATASARQSQDFSANMKPDEHRQEAFANNSSSLHASAPTFGPQLAENGMPSALSNASVQPYGQQPYFPSGYAMQMLNTGFGNMALNGNTAYGQQSHWPAQLNGMPQQGLYGVYPQFQQGAPAGNGVGGRYDGQRVSMQQRRQAAEEAQARFNSISIDQLVGEIYGLCKDQHGCRFLQRKLEERNEQTVQIIFDEVKTHMIDLMVDPFGNYLCQKLLESANDDQRTTLIRNAMPNMTRIALNQHGTRALQKMIEFITTPEQTALIIEALGNDVVVLIQDLNGNHVIQKLLNHLSSADAQFIFDAVGNHCVVVGTHRHGCCVLQRCIDHADGLQKGQIVDHVIANAHGLVQDPFGNYVIQYILDLAEPCFTEPLCRAFLGDILALSKQKFSSNVVEKCIRCCGSETRRAYINEIAPIPVLERLLRDGFANYVVQTAMDFADDELKRLLIGNVRALLPSIRNTPHGRRIQSKIADYDNQHGNAANNILTPIESATGVAQPPFAAATQAAAQTFSSQTTVAPQSLAAQTTTAPQTFSVQSTTAGTQPFSAAATNASQSFGAPAATTPRSNRHGIVGPPSQWSPNSTSFDMPAFGASNHNGDNIVSPIPQRSPQSYNNLFAGGQSFQNSGYNGQGSQPYGHF